jgi:hypothetical protein
MSYRLRTRMLLLLGVASWLALTPATATSQYVTFGGGGYRSLGYQPQYYGGYPAYGYGYSPQPYYGGNPAYGYGGGYPVYRPGTYSNGYAWGGYGRGYSPYAYGAGYPGYGYNPGYGFRRWGG